MGETVEESVISISGNNNSQMVALIRSPEPLVISVGEPEKAWQLWRQQFNFFATATNLRSKSTVVQVATLMSTVGAEAQAIYNSFELTEEQTLESVLKKFDEYFSSKTNLIFERSKDHEGSPGQTEGKLHHVEKLDPQSNEDGQIEKLTTFGASATSLEHCIPGGIIVWGSPVSDVLTKGEQLIKQLRTAADSSRLVSVLLEGPRTSGKTALAAEIAKRCNFPFIKVCSPEDMVGYSEAARCASIRKVFDDAYQSHSSCILLDDIENLVDYSHIGPRYSNSTVLTLRVLLKKLPPKGKKLLVLCTSSIKRSDLEEMELLSLFTTTLHVLNLSKSEHLIAVLEMSHVFSRLEIISIVSKLENREIFIGIKKVLGLIDAVRQVEDESRVPTFLFRFEEAFSANAELLEHYIPRGFIAWGSPISSILTEVQQLVKQLRIADAPRLVSVLLEGPPNSGKTALAAEIARRCNFPFVKVCNPEDMAGYSEATKCASIRKVFDDVYQSHVYQSHLSCILIDDIDRLVDYIPRNRWYPNSVLQYSSSTVLTLNVLLKKLPPKGKKLLVLCTSNIDRSDLEEMKLLSLFKTTLHIPNLSKIEHLISVLEQSGVFNRIEIANIASKLENREINIGIKKWVNQIGEVRHGDFNFRHPMFIATLSTT